MWLFNDIVCHRCLPYIAVVSVGCTDRAAGGADSDEAGSADASESMTAGEATAGPLGDSWFGEDPSDCADPEVDGEILACGGQAHALAVGVGAVYWVAGSTAACACPGPAVYVVNETGGTRTKLIELPETPQLIAASSRVAFSTDDIVFELDGAGFAVLDAQGAWAIRAYDTMVYWSGKSDGRLWASAGLHEPATDLLEGETDVGLFDLGPDGVAWVGVDGLVVRSGLLDEPLYESSDRIRALEVEGESVVWATPSTIYACPLAGGPVQELATEPGFDIVALEVDGTAVYYGLSGSVGALKVASLAGGAPQTVVAYERDAGVVSVAIDGGYVYWIDGRIVRRALD